MGILDWLKILILGIVEGITEWLPISSTGHMILVDEFWKTLGHSVLTEDFMEMFMVVIQLGAILAVLVLYFPKLWPFRKKDPSAQCTGLKAYCDMDKITLWLKIALSCIPAIALGLPLDDWMDANLYNGYVVAAMLIVYGIGFILVERRNKGRKARVNTLKELSWTDAALIGVFQVLSLIPGTSRSGATILGGILIGTRRELAAEYTFFLAIPVMFGASALKLVKFGFAFTGMQLAVLLVGMAVAFVVSILAIKFLVGYIKQHDFSIFGWYRIALGLLVLLLFALL
ncbi:MAG: undecaprenyl-diphosphate phosphatase [Oscillospiraceae bacterium]|nr:undecaprenyl-diphosphate phosphatase [Oscillospiraceae bacterium]